MTNANNLEFRGPTSRGSYRVPLNVLPPAGRIAPMTVPVLTTRTYGDQIFSQLAAEILTGRYLPGENLPSERTLAEVLQVNRQVVREALKRLAQVGLTSIQQGGGNRVLDYRHSAGLDLMALIAEHADVTSEVGDYWQHVLEMRVAVAADAARLFTLRAAPEHKSELAGVCEAIRASSSDLERAELDRKLWELLFDHCGNIAYRLSFNTMRRSTGVINERTVSWLAFELAQTNGRHAMVSAILAGDAERAESECRTGLRKCLDVYVQRQAERRAAGTVSEGPRPAPENDSHFARTLRALERPSRPPKRRSDAAD
jgi:GntR family transcriptional regulator, transcriptional repressor for pyruvate dehydrogenase complex